MSRFFDKDMEMKLETSSSMGSESFIPDLARSSELRASINTLLKIFSGLGRGGLDLSLTSPCSRFGTSTTLYAGVSQLTESITGLELSWLLVCSGGAFKTKGQSMKRYGVVKPMPPAPVSILYDVFAQH